MDYIVMKFGGTATSTSKTREKIINIISKIKNKKILLVVSAMGRVGFPYATDTLLNLIDTSMSSKKEIDELLACGEIISSVVISNSLNQNNIKAQALSLKEIGLFFNNDFSFKNSKIVDKFSLYNVLVVPGFIALNDDENFVTLKRGGGDLSACVFAKYLNCSKVYLFKDVDGILPFISPGYKNLKFIRYLNYEEASALRNIGFKIIQQDALDFAFKNNLKIIVSNYESGKVGTIIGSTPNNKRIIGMNFTKNSIKIATLSPTLVDEQIKKNFSNCHLFFKSFTINKNYVEYALGVNQLQLAKKMLIETYFKDYLY